MAEIPAAVARAAAAFGLDVAQLVQLGGNLGSSWGAGRQVLRVGRGPVMAAEAAAASAVADVVPVPRIIDRRELGGDTAVLLEWLPGLTAADLARREPARARDAGLICGQVHARLAGVRAPAGLRAVPGAPVSAARGSGAGGRCGSCTWTLHPFNILLGGDGALAGGAGLGERRGRGPVFDRARTGSGS